MENQGKTLLQLRGGYQFDSLEAMLHLNTLELISQRLYNKTVEAKAKNPSGDYTEQEKVVEMYQESLRWVRALEGEFNKRGWQLHDLALLNNELRKKIEQTDF